MYGMETIVWPKKSKGALERSGKKKGKLQCSAKGRMLLGLIANSSLLFGEPARRKREKEESKKYLANVEAAVSLLDELNLQNPLG